MTLQAKRGAFLFYITFDMVTRLLCRLPRRAAPRAGNVSSPARVRPCAARGAHVSLNDVSVSWRACDLACVCLGALVTWRACDMALMSLYGVSVSRRACAMARV